MRVGSTLADARAALPELLSASAQPARDQRSLVKLAHWLGRYGPARNRDGPDGVWIDVTGVAHLFGGEDRMRADLAQRLSGFGITARTGIGSTLGAAHALARYSPGLDTSANDALPAERASLPAERGALAALPIEGLRLAPETIVLLKRLGLRRIGQLYDIPRVALERRFRADRSSKNKARQLSTEAGAVLMRLDQALGLRPEPLRPLCALPDLSVRRTWGEPLISAQALDGEIAGLVEELGDTLKAQGLGIRQAGLTLYRADGTLGQIRAGFSSATCEPLHMLDLIREKLSTLDAGFGIDMAALDGHGAETIKASQASLAAQGTSVRSDAAALLIDRLINRLGPQSIYRLVAHASHSPERAQRRRPAGAVCEDTPVRPAALCHVTLTTPCRPSFLLQPPEPVTVMAEVPEGIPRYFIWRRMRHRVIKGEGPERIEPEWWRWLNGKMPGGPAVRDYYHLESETGGRFWLFREGSHQDTHDASLTSRWFVHGLFA